MNTDDSDQTNSAKVKGNDEVTKMKRNGKK